jgi:hypothetical protein
MNDQGAGAAARGDEQESGSTSVGKAKLQAKFEEHEQRISKLEGARDRGGQAVKTTALLTAAKIALEKLWDAIGGNGGS